jgi:hypothetical protein
MGDVVPASAAACGSLDATGVALDLCEKEQSALARQYVLSSALDTNEPWSHAGPRSISPFAPCASSRVPHILAAARLDERSVLWDLGCGDGRVLHEAAARYGCRCVGIEIDKPCLVECERNAKLCGEEVDSKCSWHLNDITSLPPGSLGRDDALGANVPSPTVLLLFITGHGLCALSKWLKREWETASKPFAVITCVEALDTCVDVLTNPNPLFDQETNPDSWRVFRDAAHARFGVFVTPPRGVSLEDWERARFDLKPIHRDAVESVPPRIVRGVLDDDDIRAIEALVERAQPGFFRAEQLDAPSHEIASGEEEALAARLSAAFLSPETAENDSNDSNDSNDAPRSLWSDAEDACHAHGSHRVVHLHANDMFTKYAPRARARLVRAAYACDGDRGSRSRSSSSASSWDFLRGRSIFVRCAEYHAYVRGGGVVDPTHRDSGSVLTVSVVLETPSSSASGGVFFTRDDGDGGSNGTDASGASVRFHEDLRRGDAVVFPSEKRHGVTPLAGDDARRRSVVLELWEGGVTRRNRHE